jgi:hypothetical protein
VRPCMPSEFIIGVRASLTPIYVVSLHLACLILDLRRWPF